MTKVEITAIHFKATDKLEKYVTRKFGRLERYLPRSMRGEVRIEVKLKQPKGKGQKQCGCEAIMHLPNERLQAEETTVNSFAAVDIVERKLKSQLDRYKSVHLTTHAGKSGRMRRILLRLRARQTEE